MAKQVVKLGLEFDTKQAIQSYRDLVSELSKGGADPKAIRQFTAAIEKAETELAQLAAEGSTGFTDSKGIEQYQKKVLKTVTSMQQLALRMQEFSKSGDNFPTSEVKKLEAEIEKLKKKITDAQKAAKEGLIKSLTTNGGFSKKDAEIIAETVKTEEQLIAKLEEEKKLRDEIRKAAQPAAEKATNAIKDKDVARSTSGSQIVMDSVGMKGRKGVKAIREAVATSLQEGIKEGWKAEDIKKNALDAMKQAGISEKLAKEFEASFDLKVIEKELKRVNDDIAKNSAVKRYNEANKSYNQVASGSTENYSQFITKSKEAKKAQQDLVIAENQVSQAALNSANAQKKNADSAGQQATKAEQAANSFMQMSDAQKENLKSTEALEGGFNRLADRLKYMFGFTAMFNKLRQVIRSTFNDIQELDKAYASIAYVTNETVGSLWQTYSDYANMAEKLGQSTADVIKASAIYRQQGLDTAEAIELTTDTMKLATIAGNDYSTATQEMTAALRGFKMEMNEGSHVSDVYSELAAHAAASVDDIAQAMSRTASIANSAGMSFENTSAFLTQMIETTQESAENIGTSMKTIIARFTELKENIAGTADSEFDDLDFNKVDTALKSVGVSLKDTTGQFRNLDDVFLELSEKWSTLDRNTQRYIATVAAGSRQQSRFIAMMDNYDRTIELIDTVADSEGKAEEQFAKAADTVEFKLNAIQTKWEELKLSIMDSNFVKNILDKVNLLMDGVKNIKMPQLAIGLTIAAPVLKNFVLTLINSIKNSSKQWQTIGSNITNLIGKGVKKHPVKLIAEIENLSNTYNNLKKKKEEIEQQINSHPITIRTNIDEGSAERMRLKLANLTEGIEDITFSAEEWAEELKGCGIATEDLIPLLEQMTNGEEISAREIMESIKALQQQKEELQKTDNEIKKTGNNITLVNGKLQGMRYGFTTVGSAITIFATSMFSGMNAVDSFSAANSMLITSLASLAYQAVPQVVAAIQQGSVEAKAALVSTGIGAAIVAAGLLIGLIGKAIAKAKQHQKEMTVSFKIQQQINKISNLQQSTNQVKNDLQAAKDELKTTEEKIDRFKVLSEMQIRTTEEQKEYNDLVVELRSEYPAIVESYDSITGELTIQEDKTKNILDMQKQLVAEQQKSYALAQNNLYDAQIRKTNLETTQNLERYGDITSLNLKKSDRYAAYSGNISDARNKSQNWDKTSTFSQGIANAISSGLNSEQAIEYNLERYGIDKDTFLTQIGQNKILTEDQWDKLAERLENNSDDIYEIIKESVEKSTRAIQDERDKVIQYYKDMKAASIKQTLLTEFENLGEASADAISKSAIDNIYRTIAQEKTSDYINQMATGYTGSFENSSAYGGIWAGLGAVPLIGPAIALGGSIYTSTLLNNLDKWEDLDDDTKNIWKEVAKQNGHEDAAVWYEEIRYDDEDYQPYLEDFASIAETYFSQKIAEDIAVALESNPELAQTFEDFSSKLTNGELNKGQLDEQFIAMQKAIQDSNLDSMTKQGLLQSLYSENNQYEQNLSANKTQASKLINDENYLNNLNLKQLGEISSAVDKIINSVGEKAGQTYLDKLAKMMEQYGPEMTANLATAIDFSEAKDYNWEDFKEKGIQKIMEMAHVNEDTAKTMFNNLAEAAEKSGILNKLMKGADVNSLQEQIAGREEALLKHKDIVDKIMGTNKPLKLTQQEIKNLQKAISDLAAQGVNLDLTKYLQGDILDAQAFNDALTNGLLYSIEDIDQAIKNLRAAGGNQNLNIAESLEKVKTFAESFNTGAIETFKDNWSELDRIINDATNDLEKADKAINQFTNDGYVNAESLELINSLLDDTNDLYKYVDSNLTLNVEGLKELIHTELEDIKVKYTHGEATAYQVLKLAALEKQISNTEKEWDDQSKDLKDNHKKAMEDYAKAQQDVIDKQKDLNEAIAEYNKLLYGSDNRKSTLGPLYNYQQAISYLNDEISRTKEILEDSKGFDEASENLNKYLSAAHYQLIQYQAENKVLEEGLAIRRNNLLNGSVSYQGINVKFGDYVKIDEKTGLASIDQQLIQNAKIADKWKDQIESFVDDYNKYSQELLKNQDAVRKAEKEIQQLRMDATKKWADFEKSIAETLKNEYQEEVDALKEKYNSMKDADDDYVNALEEAINKQRKLRDRENQWEQLAQKEKKLSLLRRDTSGANTLATKKLEKEIEQDREKMLDDKIDDVIENIQKLSEKQDELRQTEIELKEALLDDALYWNMTAETVAQSFTSVDEFLSWSVKHNKEYLEMTEQQRQEFLDSETKKFNESIGAMAILTRDEIDSIENQIEVTAEEINTTVQNTGEVFTTEVSRVINETSAELNKEIADAQNKIQSAIQALVDANEKLREASQKVDEIAAKLAGLSYSGGSYATTSTPAIDYSNTSANYAEQVGTGQTVGQHEIEQRKIESAFNNFKNLIASNRGTDNYLKSIQGDYATVSTPGLMGAELEELAKLIISNYKSFSNHILVDTQSDNLNIYKNGVPLDPFYTWNPKFKIYKNGGLVNYTGPAWVDGTPNTPEAFLSAEDTERIGNAAKLLSNVPALNHSNISTTNSSYGDTNIEINLNIDHVSSDVDIEEMLNRVKQEIVDIARPTGTNVILHQQI